MSHSGPENNRTVEPRSENPRRVRHGIKLKSRDGLAVQSWIAQRWMSLIESAIDAETMAQGMVYAKAGQLASLEYARGEINARVQGRAARAYVTQLRLDPVSEAQWESLISAMAGGAIYVARLLDGELPPSLAELFDSLHIELVPADAGRLGASCTCSEPKPCKHAAAVALIVAEQLEANPTLIFTVYGMPVDRVLDRLRQVRAMHTHGVASSHADPMIPESQIDPLPLEACLDEFWRPGPQLSELEQAPPPQHVAHALLRRLGPSPMQGRFPMVGLLASIYDAVSKEAIVIRDRAEHIERVDDDE